jgi:polar amino acid transport system substrate-binding protein
MLKFKAITICCIWALSTVTSYAQTLEIATEEFPPFNFTQDGEIAGLNTKVVEEMCRRAGINYQITSYPWSRAYNLVLEKPGTAIYTMSRRANREDLFRWVGPIITSKSYLYRLAGNDDVKVKNLEDAKKYQVAVVQDDVRYSYLVDNNFDRETNLTVLRKYELGWEMLLRGRVDIWAMPDQVARQLLDGKNVPRNMIEPVFLLKEVSSALYHVGLHLSTSDEIVDRLQKALDEMKSDNTFQQIADGKI